jgi:hypothetical protein
VSIVSANPETLDSLQAYFAAAGVSSQGTDAVRNLDVVAPRKATAAVIFPDDFEGGDIITLLRDLRRHRPRLLSVLVTREPQRIRDMVPADDGSLAPVMLPKPSFGWDILDAIRAHTDAIQVPFSR